MRPAAGGKFGFCLMSAPLATPRYKAFASTYCGCKPLPHSASPAVRPTKHPWYWRLPHHCTNHLCGSEGITSVQHYGTFAVHFLKMQESGPAEGQSKFFKGDRRTGQQIGPYSGPGGYSNAELYSNYPYATLVNASYYPVFRDCLPLNPVRRWPFFPPPIDLSTPF